jgi:hypothetical protein
VTTKPNPGDLIEITAAAGPAVHPMLARVVRVNDWPVWEGNAWLEVSELHSVGVSGAPRMAYVRTGGVRIIRTAETHEQTRRRVLAQLQHNGHAPSWKPVRPRKSTENHRRNR